MKKGVLFLALLFAFPFFAEPEPISVDANKPSANEVEPNTPCSDALTKRGVSAEDRFNIAVERSTDEIAQLLTSYDPLSRNSYEWVTVDLVQDQSHLAKSPPIPGFALTFIARSAFNKKIRTRLDDQRPDSDFPKLKKMYFSKQSDQFKGVTTTLSAHTIIKIKVKDLPVVVDWFVETMYHPTLGNKVFKISLLD